MTAGQAYQGDQEHGNEDGDRQQGELETLRVLNLGVIGPRIPGLGRFVVGRCVAVAGHFGLDFLLFGQHDRSAGKHESTRVPTVGFDLRVAAEAQRAGAENSVKSW